MPNPKTLLVIGSAMTILRPASAQEQVTPPPSYSFSSGSAALNIPVEVIANGLVLLRANVNDHPGWFILDNGSQGFLVDKDYAKQISLQSSDSNISRGGGPNQVPTGIVRDVRIGLPGLDLTHRNLVVIALKMLEPTLGHAVDGIIGSRLFDDFVVAVDYERSRVSIYLPSHYEPGKEKAIPISIDSHGFQFVAARISLPGVEPINSKFLIDGGANTYADIYKSFADAHHVPPPAMKLLDEPGSSTGGTTQSRDGRAAEIGIGLYSVKNPPIMFAGDTEGLMAAKDYAGLIGTEFLERFTVVFDSLGKRLFLTPNHHYADIPEYDGSGLRIRAEGPAFRKFIVGRIVPHSPAAEAGIEAGDIIESIDNHPADQLTLTEIRSHLCRANTRVEIGILRGNDHLRFAITLHPLI